MKSKLADLQFDYTTSSLACVTYKMFVRVVCIGRVYKVLLDQTDAVVYHEV